MFTVRVRSPEKILLEEEAQSVRLPGASGTFEVLAYHAPFVSALTGGRLVIQPARPSRGSVPRVQAIRGGLAWMSGNRLTVLVER